MPAAPQLSFALNHMAAPSLRPDLFFELCRKVGVTQAEIRNDLSGNAIIDGTPAAAIGQQARDAGILVDHDQRASALQRLELCP